MNIERELSELELESIASGKGDPGTKLDTSVAVMLLLGYAFRK